MADAEGAVEARRLIFPGLAGLYNRFAPLSYAFMRFSAGAILFPHGVQKVMHLNIAGEAVNIAKHGMPFPVLLAGATVFSEFIASACLALGFLTRLMAAVIFIEMTVIVFFWQWRNGYFWTKGGYEFALLWALLMIAIFFRGGGRYSIDRMIGKEL